MTPLHSHNFNPDAEVKMWCGVIRNAIIEYRRDCKKYANQYQGSRYKAFQMDAQHWLFRSQYDGPGSLIWICQFLGLDPAEVRKKAMSCDLRKIMEYQRQTSNK